MKTKILGLLAVGLLAGPMAANAAYTYSFTGSGSSFTLNTESLITSVRFFEPSDFDELTNLQGSGGVLFQTLDEPNFFITFFGDSEPSFATFAFNTGPVNSPGTYCASSEFCGYSLTLRETSSVPEPGTLAMLGLGLAGLGLSRRRKAN